MARRDDAGAQDGRQGVHALGDVAQALPAASPREDVLCAQRGQHRVASPACRSESLRCAPHLGAVVDRVHGRHVGQERLRGADVGGGLLAADVLLARLEGQAQRLVAVRVARHADQAARHLAGQLRLAREERGVRAAVAERHAEALRRAERDVRAKVGGRLEHGERQQVRRKDQETAGLVHRLAKGGVVADRARRARVLDQRAAQVGCDRAKPNVATGG